MDSRRKVSQVFNNNPQGSPQRVRPKINRWWNCVQTDNDSCKIKKSGKRSKKNRAEWEKSIKEANVCIGL